MLAIYSVVTLDTFGSITADQLRVSAKALSLSICGTGKSSPRTSIKSMNNLLDASYSEEWKPPNKGVISIFEDDQLSVYTCDKVCFVISEYDFAVAYKMASDEFRKNLENFIIYIVE